MKKAVNIILVLVVIALGIFLGMFIYKKTNIQSFVEKKKNESFSKDVVITVADEKVAVNEAKAYLEAMRSQVESIYGPEVWDYVTDDEGTTYSNVMKQGVLEKIVYIKLVCANAKQYGVSLSADDEIDVNQYTKEFFASINEETANKYNLTEDVIKKIYGENILARKVYDKITLNYEVDANEENCRQADFLVIEIDKYKLDENGNRVYFSEEELEEIEKKAKAAYSASSNEEFSQVAMRYSDNTVIEITTGAAELPLEITEEVMKLKTGEKTQVLENNDSYFIYYCVNEMNEDKTAQEIEDTINKKRDDYFGNLYTLWREGTSIDVNDAVWKGL